MKIFIQIASYRDPELLPTIRDCINTAAYPERLTFGIAWQHAEGDSLEEFKDDPRFRILDIPYQESKGVCWARSQTQALYQGEEFTLQIDSHHRFAEHWDEQCINILQSLQQDGFSLPILSSYAPVYDPSDDPHSRGKWPMKIDFDSFLESGTVFARPSELRDQVKPINARFISAHMLFTLGRFCRDVPYDPEYYFHGEELNLAVRAYTHGYDLFHPHVIICWHEYIRKNKSKHWDDYKDWSIRERESRDRNKTLFGLKSSPENKSLSQYGFGVKRTLRDYERYAGIDFSERALSQEVIKKSPPSEIGLTLSDQEWKASLQRIIKHKINSPHFLSKICSFESLAVIYEDENGNSIHRHDYDYAQIQAMIDGRASLHLKSEFYAPAHICIAKWIVWAHHPTSGWGVKLVGAL